MKKLSAFLFFLLILLIGISLWMLSQTRPEKANSETITVEVEDSFEK